MTNQIAKPDHKPARLTGAHFPELGENRFPDVDIVDLSKEATDAQASDAQTIAYALQVISKHSGTIAHLIIYDDGTLSAWVGWTSERASLIDTGKPRTVKRSVLAVRSAYRVFSE